MYYDYHDLEMRTVYHGLGSIRGSCRVLRVEAEDKTESEWELLDNGRILW